MPAHIQCVARGFREAFRRLRRDTDAMHCVADIKRRYVKARRIIFAYG